MPVTSTLRGRDTELSALRHAVETACAGSGAIVVVEGAPGLGKTRLLDETAALAVSAGALVGRGGAFPGRLSAPLEPLLAALYGYVLDPQPVDVRAGHDYWLVQDLQEQLERRALAGPVVLLLDDLQWADAATLGTLRALGPALAESAIAWVLAFRPGEASPALRRVTRELRGLTAALTPLDEDASLALVGDLVGGVVEPRLAALAARAGGNPFLLGELVAGRRDASGPVARVREATAARLEPLPDAAREVAAIAAVLGRRARLADIATMLGAPAASLLGPVDALCRADVLVTETDGLHFRHDLVRDAVLETIPGDTRAALDRQAADVLLAAGASPIEIATRMAAFARPGDERAIDVLQKAAHLLGASDPATACELSLKALELTPHAAPRRGELLQETALLLYLAGRADEARALAADVSALSVAERGRVALSVATMFGLSSAVRVEASERVLELADLPIDLRAAHAAILVLNLISDGQPEEAHEALRYAEPLVAASGDPAAGAMLALSRLGLTYVDADFGGVLAQVRTISDRYGGSAEERLLRHGVEYFRALALQALGRTDECLDHVGSWLMSLREARQSVLAPRSELDRGRALYYAGRLTDAQAGLQGVLIDGVIPSPLPIPADTAGMVVLARIAIHTGDAALGQRCLAIVRESLVVDRSEGRRHLVWALVQDALARRDADGVRAALALGDARVLPALSRDPFDAVELVRAALLIGDAALARGAVAEARRVEERNPGVALLAAARAHAEGLLDGDVVRLAAAVVEHGRPLPLASAWEDLGVALGSGGIDALGSALDLWTRCGAVWDARRVRRRLRVLGVRRRAAVEERPAHGWESLTGSQRQVVELVAAGLTNRETAERLFVSPHTVNTHLRHAFAKLGVSSRVELARLVARRG